MATHSERQPHLEHIGSLITYRDDDGDRCLGYLMCFEGHGVYDPTFGRVEITPEQAETHNELLDEAMLAGLDENCQVGMGGSFYVGEQDGRVAVKTFIGTVVSTDCVRHGRSLTFKRNGKVFRGRTSQKRDLFHFRRVG